MFGFGTPDCDKCGGAYVGNPNPVLPLCYCSRTKVSQEEKREKEWFLEKMEERHLAYMEERFRKEREEREKRNEKAKMKSVIEELAEYLIDEVYPIDEDEDEE